MCKVISILETDKKKENASLEVECFSMLHLR